MDAHGHGAFALRLFEARSEIKMAILVENSEHVGVESDLAGFEAEESEGEAD
jgi:hypothetical protein